MMINEFKTTSLAEETVVTAKSERRNARKTKNEVKIIPRERMIKFEIIPFPSVELTSSI